MKQENGKVKEQETIGSIVETAIEVMTAYTEGSEIEGRRRGDKDAKWELLRLPTWNWDNCEYRVKSTGAFATPDTGLVGGMIFHIDYDSDEEVVFYDEDGHIIKDVGLGDMPYSYEIMTKGSKPKYWVFSHNVSKPLRWKPSGAEGKTFGTSYDFGTGRANTEKVLADKSYAKSKESIWDYLVVLRKKTGICDWFVPSQEELELLMGFFAIHEDDLKLINLFNVAYLWTSSEDEEYSAQYARLWDYNNQSFSVDYKNYDHSLCAVRAF